MYGWIVVALLALTQLAAFTDRALIALLSSPLKQSFGLTDTQLGLLQGPAFVVFYAIAMIPFGRLADRSNRIRIVIGCTALWSCGTALCGLAHDFNSLALGRVLVGLGQAGLAPCALSLISAYLDRRRIGFGVSLFTSGSTLGRSMAFLAGGFVLATLTPLGYLSVPAFWRLEPWQGVFVIAALANIPLLILLAAFVTEPARTAQAGRVGYRLTLAWIGRHWRTYLPHTVAASCAVLMIQTLTPWAPTFFLRRFGVPTVQSGAALGTIILLVAPTGHLFGGLLIDRLRRTWGRRAPALLLAASLGLSLPAATAFCVTGDVAVAFGAFAVLTLFLGLSSPASLGGLQILTPRRLRGQASALFICCTTLVSLGLGPPAVGLLNDTLFGEAGLAKSLLAVFAASAVGGCAAAAFGLVRRRRLHRA